MAAVLLSWLYIFTVCLLIGVGVFRVIGRLIKVKPGLIHFLAAGIVTITVYVEIFSIFYKISLLAHAIMLAAALAFAWFGRKQLGEIRKRYKGILLSWEGFFFVCFLFFIAFFTSRGTFHTDTNIYHAQAIRLYEEYGLIRGMGNLQLHFGYNSAYLAFASIFSLEWLFGQSLHTTTGFLEAIMCIYAFHGLKGFKNHKSHLADMMRVGILFYALVMLNGSMSPATDYATMLMSLFLLTAWCENMEGRKDGMVYSLLSVVAVFVITMKFSAGFLILLVIYPAVYLIREKKGKEILAFIFMGCVILVPFLVRNFLISGWLLYPFDGIDIFNVEWKVPKEYLLVDANQIKVWGRCLYDVTKIDMPVSEWISIWWSNQERYEQMLIGAAVIGSGLLLTQTARKLLLRKKLRWDYGVLLLTIFANLGLWFFQAPFIRYGLCFLFAVPMLAIGEWLSEEKRGLYSIVTGGLVFCTIVSLSPYWDHYITDAGVFIKQNLTEPYYLVQKDYDRAESDSYDLNGNEVYYSIEGIVNDYHIYPSTCYEFMLERTTLMGDRIEDGFRAK